MNWDSISSDPCDIMESGWQPEDIDQVETKRPTEVQVFLVSGYTSAGKSHLMEMMGTDVIIQHVDNEDAYTIGQVYHAAIVANGSARVIAVETNQHAAPQLTQSLRDLVANIPGASFRHITIGR